MKTEEKKQKSQDNPKNEIRMNSMPQREMLEDSLIITDRRFQDMPEWPSNNNIFLIKLPKISYTKINLLIINR